MSTKQAEFTLSAKDRAQLEKITGDGNVSRKIARRAWIVLMTADGVGVMAIRRAVGVSKTTVWRWQEYFAEAGVAGLVKGRSKPPGKQAIGRSRGGLTTKIHALVDALGNPVEVMLTPGQAHDLTCAEPLLEAVEPGALLGDKAFDADTFIDTLQRRNITPVIPPKANRKAPRNCDFALYCERNLIERFFNKLKHFRASPHATTNSPKISSPASNLPAL